MDEAIDIVTRTFIDVGATVIIITPTFGQFEIAALWQEAIPVKLSFLTKQGYEFDTTKVNEAVQLTKNILNN